MKQECPIIAALCSELGFSSNQLMRLIARAPHTYKTYKIPKKTSGFRTIAQPARETKILQNWLIHNVFKDLPVSESASAYKKGASIKKNASHHKDSSYLLKMDFKNFFESIDIEMIKNHLISCLDVSRLDASAIARICSIDTQSSPNHHLSIGAPSSPILSNSFLFNFDLEAEQWCKENNCIYTRYADDIFVSTNAKSKTKEAEQLIEKLVNELLPGLKLNHKKTKHLSKKFNRTITGLVISNDNEVTLGRDRKREVRKSVFLYTKGLLEHEQVEKLQGTLSFAKHIDPVFLSSLQEKFGSDIIGEIFNARRKTK